MGDILKESIRGVLFNNVTLNGNIIPIYPGHITDESNPVYPCISLNRKGGTRPDQLGKDLLLLLSVWSKTGNTELWNIYNQVNAILDLKGIDNSPVLLMREIYTNDNLFEQKTYTYQLSARYKVDMM